MGAVVPPTCLAICVWPYFKRKTGREALLNRDPFYYDDGEFRPHYYCINIIRVSRDDRCWRILRSLVYRFSLLVVPGAAYTVCGVQDPSICLNRGVSSVYLLSFFALLFCPPADGMGKNNHTQVFSYVRRGVCQLHSIAVTILQR